MKKLTFFYLLFQASISFGQEVRIEIGDYNKTLDGKEYSTYQFVDASYSYSRPTIIFITSRNIFFELIKKFAERNRGRYKEYTDVWILGIPDFNSSNIKPEDTNVIHTFLNQIIKYRSDNNLVPYPFEQLDQLKVYLNSKNDIGKFY